MPTGYYPGTSVPIGWGYGRDPVAPTPPPQGGSGTLPNYPINPQPQPGSGAYGRVPGPVQLPPSVWEQFKTAIPGLADTSQLSRNIMSELQGEINPQAMKNMQDAAASYGVSSGMPGSNAVPGTLAFNKNLRNIGLDTQAIQQQGLKGYTDLLGAIGGSQTAQMLAAEIAARNAALAAAPDPREATQQQQSDYWRALNQARNQGPGNQQRGGPAEGTGVYNPDPFQGGGLPIGTPSSGSMKPWGGFDTGAWNDLFWDQGSSIPASGQTPYDPGIFNDMFWDQGTNINQNAQPDLGSSPYYDENAFYDWGGG